MAISEVDIYNLALGHIGHTETVTGLNENTKARKTCSRFYDQARDELLTDGVWPFALRAVALAEVANATFPGYEYVYRYPTDCLNAHQITDDDGSRINWSHWFTTRPGQPYIFWIPPRVPFRIAGDDDGKTILTDLEDAYLIYTSRVETTSNFSTAFVACLAYKLAMYIASPMSADLKRRQELYPEFQSAWDRAQAVEQNEGRPDPRPESPSISGRY